MRETIKLILSGDGAKLDGALNKSSNRLKAFGGAARREFDSLRTAARSLEGRLAAIGVSFGAVVLMKQSAELDKQLTRIGQTGGESRVKVIGLRKELFRMAQETGQEVENLKAGFDNAVQAGLSFKEALPVTDAVNKAMAVTGAKADQLSSGLTVAATAFQFDLSKPGLALDLLDKMTVAGRSGRAELENLSSIFARVGVNASRAGMSFDQTLGFIEGLSLLEGNPERLSTLADSTLRLFTNFQYLRRAQQATGVKFFTEKGGRRDPLAVFQDLKKKYDLLKTDQEQELFMARAFQGADLDTIKGLSTLLKGDYLEKTSRIVQDTSRAPGTIKKDLPDAIDNAVDQTGRLKARLREAADAFIQPMNRWLAKGISKLINSGKEGGLDLSGGQLAAGGTAALIGGYAAYRFGGKALKGIMGKLGGDATGIAMGKAVEAATGVTPVYVTNWPGSIVPGGPGTGWGGKIPGGPIPGPAGKLGKLGKMLPWLMRGGAAALPFLMSPAGLGILAVGGVAAGLGYLATRDASPHFEGSSSEALDSMTRDYRGQESTMVQNNVPITINVDPSLRVTATTQDLNTRVDLKRGKF